MRRHWRPDAAFLSKRRKDQLVEIAKESGASIRMGALKDYSRRPRRGLGEAFRAHEDCARRGPGL